MQEIHHYKQQDFQDVGQHERILPQEVASENNKDPENLNAKVGVMFHVINRIFISLASCEITKF